MHELLDAGLRLCPHCDAFGYRTFCGECGKRFSTRKWRTCPNRQCGVEVTTDWCSACGTQVAPKFLKEMEAGRVDWAAEAAMADEIVRKVFAARPDLREKHDLVGALNRGFGVQRHA